MIKIEWKSSHHRKPKASIVHGWLLKWRATFIGNERLRTEGIREMREAKYLRERKKRPKPAHQSLTKRSGSGLGLSSLRNGETHKKLHSTHSQSQRPRRHAHIPIAGRRMGIDLRRSNTTNYSPYRRGNVPRTRGPRPKNVTIKGRIPMGERSSPVHSNRKQRSPQPNVITSH